MRVFDETGKLTCNENGQKKTLSHANHCKPVETQTAATLVFVCTGH